MTPLIYQFTDSGREVHMMGNYVGVCFHIDSKITKVRNGNQIITTEIWNKEEYPVPYIDFISIRGSSNGEEYIDDDSPVEGGLSSIQAQQIADELILARNYVEGREWE